MRLSLIVAAIIAAVYTLDVFLEKAETSELHNEARSLYDRGTGLIAAGRPADAVEPLQRAWTLERKNRHVQLAYAEALMGAGRRDTASALLGDVVRQTPSDGEANLLLARLSRASGDFGNEAAYYHRAIYGVWDDNAAERINETRLEWIRELVARGDRKLLLGELLPLEAEAQDPAVLREVASDLLVAGAPARSAELYRSLLTAHPEDAGLEKGLGEAETAAGNMPPRSALTSGPFAFPLLTLPFAMRCNLPARFRPWIPTPRRLPSREKYDRSLGILRLVRDAVANCGASARFTHRAGEHARAEAPRHFE